MLGWGLLHKWFRFFDSFVSVALATLGFLTFVSGCRKRHSNAAHTLQTDAHTLMHGC